MGFLIGGIARLGAPTGFAEVEREGNVERQAPVRIRVLNRSVDSTET